MSRQVVNTKRMRNALSNNTRKSFVRERTIEGGPYKLFSIYTRTMKQELEAKEPRGKRKKAQSNDCAFPVSCVQASAHVREALHGLREVFDRLIGVAVLDPVAHAMLDVPLEHDLAAAVQG